MATAQREKLIGDDKVHGYKLGCDGFVSSREARLLLGISYITLWRRIRDGHIRKGKHPGGHNGICRRSLQVYIERMKT